MCSWSAVKGDCPNNFEKVLPLAILNLPLLLVVSVLGTITLTDIDASAIAPDQ
jgi:hypothetical protein